MLPFGVEAIDRRLNGEGLRLDALHEMAGEGAGWGDDAAAVLFMASIAARTQGPILWVVRSRDLFAPGLYQAGLDPARVLYAEACDDAELLALMEDGLRHRGLGAVIGEAKRVSMASTRRLQLTAEGGTTPALLLKRPAREGDDPVPWEGLGPACWRLTCVRQRGGEAFELTVEAPDETGRLALPALLVDRPAAADRATLRAVG